MQHAVKKEEVMQCFPSLDDAEVSGKAVLVRMDFNVPMQGGEVADDTRILRQLPTIKELVKKKAKVILISHFERPKGKFVPSMSLAPLVDALAKALGHEVKFGVDCVGPAAREAVGKLKSGEVLLLENLRFHAEEETNDKKFAAELASLAELYVNDAFSCSHRAHASVAALAVLLPAYAGRLMQEELETLDGIFAQPQKPIAAVVGGSKISTKLELLANLACRMDFLMVGGAMANTFLLAQDHAIGTSLHEPDLLKTAGRILSQARERGCTILLPTDVVVAKNSSAHASCRVVAIDKIPADHMILDIGPRTVALLAQKLESCRTLVWNGPMGVFETSPFDAGTISLARVAASLTGQGMLRSIAGGGDTVAALSHAGLAGSFSYISTAGGAFLEWLEGKQLPGVEALMKAA